MNISDTPLSKASGSNAQGRSVFRLLDLPSELRNAIYKWAIIANDGPQHPHDVYRHIIDKGRQIVDSDCVCVPIKHRIALVYTCRQVYNEAIMLVYQHTHFMFLKIYPQSARRLIRLFSGAIGSAKANYITTVHLKFPGLKLISYMPEMATLDQTDLTCLLGLRESFPSLGTLFFWMATCRWSEYLFWSGDDVGVKKELAQISDELKKFPALSQTCVFWRGVTFQDFDFIRILLGFGWIVDDEHGSVDEEALNNPNTHRDRFL